jgi:hypothetical protein
MMPTEYRGKKQAKRMHEIGLGLFYATHFNPHTRVEGQIE